MQEIQFGMLQTAKAREITASRAGVAGAQIGKAEDIYSEYEKYKEQLDGTKNTGDNGEKPDYTVSPAQLEALLSDTVEEFEEYYAIINESADTAKNNNGKPNEDDKNKIQPKEFGSFMA